MKKRRKCVMRYHKFSKFSVPEQYYMVLLQLYMSWRDENAIIDSFTSYEEKFNDVFPNIEDNILEHKPYFGIWCLDDDDLENNSHIMDIDASHENEKVNDNASNNEYSAFDPNLLDFDSGFEDGDIPSGPVASSLLENSGLPLDTYYKTC